MGNCPNQLVVKSTSVIFLSNELQVTLIGGISNKAIVKSVFEQVYLPAVPISTAVDCWLQHRLSLVELLMT